MLKTLLIAVCSYPVMLSAQTYSIVDGNNAFAVDFYKACVTSNKGNIFVSPFSISVSMAMIYPGARDSTALEIQKAMGFLKNTKRQNMEFSYLVRDLTEGKSPLNIANFLWVQTGRDFEGEFLKINATYFGSGFRELDLKKEPSLCEI